MGTFSNYPNTDPVTAEIRQLTPQSLEQLERTLTASLYAIWRAQGKQKRVVEIRQNESSYTRLTGDIEE